MSDSDSEEDVLPSTADAASVSITMRLLVSRRESGVIIGKNGDVISQIRNDSNVKAGVSRLVDGCIERILTVSGAVSDVAASLGAFATVLAESAAVSTPYNLFPLKPLCPPMEGTASLRLMVPHAQIGTLIGKGGIRIQRIQEKYHVKMVASKEFLRNSTERVVEIQGEPQNISEALVVIAKCLLEDWHAVTGTTYYFPSKKVLQPDSKDVTERVKFPGELVGALIGKRGVRIQEIRRDSGCTIVIDPEDDSDAQRTFVLTGSAVDVEKALALLYGYLEREKQRRAQST